MKHSMNKLAITIKTLMLTSLFAAGAGVYGDDTEVFYSVNVSKPNLLFVLDVSGSMRTLISGSDTPITFPSSISYPEGDSYQNTSNWATDSDDNTHHLFTGKVSRFRFTTINVPADAEITDAYIQFTSARRDTNHNGGRAKYKISADDSGNAPGYADFNTDPLLTTNEEWKPGNWDPGERDDDQKADDGVKELVKRIVDRDDWESGNAMAFYVSSIGNRDRLAAAFENTAYAPPQLVIKYKDGKSRIEVMKSSLRQVLEGTDGSDGQPPYTPNNVRVGLMNYGQESYHSTERENENHFAVSGVAFPVTDINAKVVDIIPTADDLHGLPAFAEGTTTVRQYLADIADGWTPTSWTPIVDSLYEAALYMRGEKVHYGQTLPTKNGAHPSTYDNDAIPNNAVIPVNTDMEIDGRDRTTTPTYKTPILSSCQENYIVLMTDGYPTYNTAYDGLSTSQTPGPLARIGGTSPGPQGPLANAITSCASPAGVGNAGTCGAELTHYIANNDNLPDPTSAFPNGQEGEQTIKTFAIGFGTGTSTNSYLKSLVTYDDGNASTDDDGFFPASSPEDLAAAFAKILKEVSAPKGTLASPGYSVNVKSGLEHEKDIYIPVFDRKNSSRWAGNLKKFKIVEDGNLRKIRGSNNVDAVDELGGFTNNALDYWSSAPNTAPDGKVVQNGGLANLLNPAVRNIVSDVVNNNLSTDARNEISDSNSSLTNDVLGLSTDATLEYRKEIINFMRGWTNGDATSSARHHMGDMLHSEPLVVTYDDGSSTGTSGTKKQYIFAGTNEGYLHAFDTSDTGSNAGKEMFAYIPSELLGTLSEHQYLNAGSQQEHKYGVDGSLTYRFIDVNGNGIVDPATDEVILYFGLRRGGSSFYALDVTKIAEPKLVWKVTKSDSTSDPLFRMGQSWSAPYLARVGVDSSASTCNISGVGVKTHCKEVMIVTGGYDADDDRNETGTLNVDDSTAVVTADAGNDVFIFDANDGTLIWSLPDSEKSKLNHSIPGGVRILDTNSNSLIDRMYFGDTGGSVWRLDLSEKIKVGLTDTVSTLNELADLGSSGNVANNQARMFFNEPDVSSMKLNGRTKFLVSIGSGFRAHPLDKVLDDKFFMVVDDSPYSPLVTTGADAYTVTTKAQLAQITVTANSISQTGSIKDGKGWMVNLAVIGEKVLATSVTVDGVVLFTTLVPEVLTVGVGIDQCAAPATQGRLYAIDILTGDVASDPLGFGNDDDSSGTGSVTGDDGDDDGSNNGGNNGTAHYVGGGGSFSTISKGEIPGKPQAIFNAPDVNDVTGECTHPVDVRIGKKLSQATGYDTCRLESIYWGDPEVE